MQKTHSPTKQVRQCVGLRERLRERSNALESPISRPISGTYSFSSAKAATKTGPETAHRNDEKTSAFAIPHTTRIVSPHPAQASAFQNRRSGAAGDACALSAASAARGMYTKRRGGLSFRATRYGVLCGAVWNRPRTASRRAFPQWNKEIFASSLTNTGICSSGVSTAMLEPPS